VKDKHESNRLWWNEVTQTHFESPLYNVSSFRKGECTLGEIELSGVGGVSGKSLLHLQCHLGLDTLSWGRLGARVVGVDYSDASIEKANQLALEIGAKNARFVCCDILELDKHLNEQFDVVFTSYGVLTWLSDLRAWGRLVAKFLKRGGIFFIAELHPTSMIFASCSANELTVGYDYFHNDLPVTLSGDDYVNPGFKSSQEKFEWQWSLADVFEALLSSGLEILEFMEYPFTVYRQFPNMIQRSRTRWEFPAGAKQIPLLFSIKATKP
jgi:2-polyprenyl-3-methyl-5-hydroxy-6-metoxy-1,4-benzoquinol methylase